MTGKQRERGEDMHQMAIGQIWTGWLLSAMAEPRHLVPAKPSELNRRRDMMLLYILVAL